MSLLNFFSDAIVNLKHTLLSEERERQFEDFFFSQMPISLIKLTTVEYRGYLRRRSPKKGDIVFDCGSWKGQFTVLASRLVGDLGRVISIEPQPNACRRLEARLKRLNIRNVTVLNCGLFDRDEIRDSYVTEDFDTGGFSIIERPLPHGGDPVQRIVLRTLDTIVHELDISALDFIKMDVEGAEIESLQGAEKTLNSLNPFLAVATYHIRDGKTTSGQVESILRAAGYNTTTEYPPHLTTYAWKCMQRPK